MTPRQIELVELSFEQVLPVSDTAAEHFYQRLFTIDPSLRALFTSSIREQGKKLMDALSIIVRNLRTIDRLVPGIRSMGVRHLAYGVKTAHYATVGQALIQTLQESLGESFTAEVSDAWVAAYTLLATTMIGAAEEVERTAVVA